MSVARRLKSALESIHATSPVRISSPPSTKRASVAIIIRLKAAIDTPLPGSPTSTVSSPPSPAPLSLHPTPTSPSAPSYAALAAQPPTSPNNAVLDHHPATTTTLLDPNADPASTPSKLGSFFGQAWVQAPGTTAEVLYIRRTSRQTDRWSGHVAFPGGKREPSDESSSYTAMRETFEEVGIDLAEEDWCEVGALDDREITTSLGKRLIMVLSPHVFLHLTPHTPIPELQEDEVASAHWVPLGQLEDPGAEYGSVAVDISQRLAPKSKLAQSILRVLVGSMYFRCIMLPNEPIAADPGLLPPKEAAEHRADPLKLWGLTLGMTIDLLKHLPPPSSDPTHPSSPPSAVQAARHSPLPSSASTYPRFSLPDLNLLVFLFGRKYRRLLARARPDSADGQMARRVDWAGMSLGAYYEAVRKALVVAIVVRGLVAVGGLGAVGLWVKRKVVGGRRGRVAVGL